MPSSFCLRVAALLIGFCLALSRLGVAQHKPGAKGAIPDSGFGTWSHGGLIRGDSSVKQLTLVFTGHEFAEGGQFLAETLVREKVPAAFFFTGDFLRNQQALVTRLVADGHYVGAHSNKHLLYCDWTTRDSLLVSKDQFRQDLLDNYAALQPYGITPQKAPYFLPPYEWYNRQIVAWTRELGFTLVNHTPGTLSHADYTTPDLKNYRSSQQILQSIILQAEKAPSGLNGYMLLSHIGAGPARTDKFFREIPALIARLRAMGYRFVSLRELLDHP